MPAIELTDTLIMLAKCIWLLFTVNNMNMLHPNTSPPPPLAYRHVTIKLLIQRLIVFLNVSLNLTCTR